jgi:hypothetical protein
MPRGMYDSVLQTLLQGVVDVLGRNLARLGHLLLNIGIMRHGMRVESVLLIQCAFFVI